MAARTKTDGPPAEPEVEIEMSDAGSSEWDIDDNDPQREAEPEPEPAPKPKRRRPAAPVLEKDSDEEELERLVLGDRAGFRAQLFASDAVADAGHSLRELSLAVAGAAAEGDDDREAFEDADDAHMFLYDESMQPHTSLAVATRTTTKDGRPDRDDPNAPKWADSDDERLRVSLAGRSQLRKLRRTEGEDVVSGAEYAARLRQNFLRLNPEPAWAAEAEKALQQRRGVASGKTDKKSKKDKKRRRKSGGRTSDDGELASDSGAAGSASDASSGSDDSDDSSDDAAFGLLEDALPLDTFFRSASAMAGASSLLAQRGADAHKKRRLRPEVIDIQKTRDIPTQHSGPVGALAFHPAHAVLLSSSTSSVLHLHQIAPGAHPTPNPLLTSVQVRQTPVRCAAFLADSRASDAGARDSHQIVFAGRRRCFHTWDLTSGKVQRVTKIQGHQLEHRSMEPFRLSPTGAHMAIVATSRRRGGVLNVLNVQTMQWVAQARQESIGGVADFQWWRNGEGLTILGSDGRVGEWRLETRRFVGMWRDDGSTGGTVLALGGSRGPEALGGDRWVAVGSRTGITNLYDRASLVVIPTTAGADGDDDIPVTIAAHPTPIRVLEQLITSVTAIAFAPDGQLMAFASRHKRDALRLVHLPSCTVYRNWPTDKTPLGRITAVAFSKDSDLLAVGNDTGKTRLWEIRS